MAAINQFGLQSDSASVAGGLQVASQGKLVSLVYATVSPGSGGCASAYQGSVEGTGFSLAVYNYGTSAMTPSEAFVNGTSVPTWSAVPSSTLAPNGLTTLSMTLPACGHSSGQTVVFVDISGGVVQFVT